MNRQIVVATKDYLSFFKAGETYEKAEVSWGSKSLVGDKIIIESGIADMYYGENGRWMEMPKEYFE